jgi:Lrp/AsnC family transcriptional regulator for asnA, asnC and gidA
MLDDLDKRIIRELEQDGRRGNVSLAKGLGVPESTVRNRVNKLLKRGLIKVAAKADPLKFGYTYISIVGLQVKQSDSRQVAEKLAQSPNVYWVAVVTGRFDLIMILMLHTPQELSDFMNSEIFRNPSISRSETFVCIDICKSPWMDMVGVAELLAGT